MKTDDEIQQLVINALIGHPYLNSSEIRRSVTSIHHHIKDDV